LNTGRHTGFEEVAVPFLCSSN